MTFEYSTQICMFYEFRNEICQGVYIYEIHIFAKIGYKRGVSLFSNNTFSLFFPKKMRAIFTTSFYRNSSGKKLSEFPLPMIRTYLGVDSLTLPSANPVSILRLYAQLKYIFPRNTKEIGKRRLFESHNHNEKGYDEIVIKDFFL